MRTLILPVLISALLAGCSGTPDIKPDVQQVTYGVEPVKASPAPQLSHNPAIFAEDFLRHYSQQRLYLNQAARTLTRQYQYHSALSSPDKRQQMLIFRSPDQSFGMIAWSMTGNSVMSSLRLRDPELGTLYFLLIRPGRLCFVTGAGQPPYWLNGWKYDRQQPGQFSCNGLTNRSAFISGSELPGKLAEYFEDGDLVLTFNSTYQRDITAANLLQAFPQLRLFP